MARFSKLINTGYLMNTNNFTLTGRFTESEIDLARDSFDAQLIETTEKVFSYGNR
jgi:hypothetical protein